MRRASVYWVGGERVFLYKFVCASLIALATGYAAQLRIPLPWTPVPITMQTFIVLLSGFVLGRWWGALSQLLYVSVGVIGFPFFSGMQGGLWVLFGPRGGYLIGFVVISFLVGSVKNSLREKSFWGCVVWLSMLYFPVMYGLGCAQLGVWLWLVKGSAPGLYPLLTMGAIPFIPGDVLKILLVALISFYGILGASKKSNQN